MLMYVDIAYVWAIQLLCSNDSIYYTLFEAAVFNETTYLM